jgi:sulfatase modifying factor 1
MMKQSLLDLAGAAVDDKTTYRFDGETKPAQTIREKLGLTADITVEKIVGIQDDDFPVYWVTQAQARTFCERLTINERAAGRLDDAWTYRLPTEAEWEYACRAGTAGTLHVGELRKESGNLNAPELNDFGWYGGNSCQDYPQGPGWNCESWAGRAFPGIKAGPRKVGQKNPNAWGLFDTLGNLQEWTSSIEDDRLTMQRVNPERSKAGPADKAIFRGGCWNNFALGCRTSSRSTEHPAFRSHYVGFRVVLALKDKGDGD